MASELAILVALLVAIYALIVVAFKLGSWYGEANSDRIVFKGFMPEVRKDIEEIRKGFKEIHKRLDNILTRLPSLPTASEGPVHLTELGERISNYTGAKDWAAEMAQELIGQTEGKNPFEIQTISFDYAKQFEPDDVLLTKMQESAFEAGIDLEGVRNVLGVELRDRLLQLNNLQSALVVT